ncbi:glycosyltransferase family 2 protein [Weissella cibaria]|nr:glycosyltransferase family 2 protein [Weissella cibaria]
MDGICDMRFSIILPTYNVSEFVRDAVFSVLNQVEVQAQFELIIVDDGFTDGTWEIVKNFSEYKNVKVYQIEHQGLGDSRNFGLLKSNGDYILYLDGDDMIDVRLLGKLESHIVNQQPDMIIFSWQRMNILGNIDSPIYGGGSIEDMWPACWNKCYRRKILSNIALMLDLRTDFSLPCKLIAEEHFLYDSIFTRI